MRLCAALFVFLVILAVHETMAGSIVLKLIAINPSKTETQKVPIRAYLPKEIKADDILEKGDLEITYDTQQGSMCATGEYTLKPGQVLEKEIEVRDIWLIPEADLVSMRAEAQKLNDILKKTDFCERITFLKNSIDSKLNEIEQSQNSPPPNPEQHISAYRENLKILEEVRADLTLARALLTQVKPLRSIVIWRLILAIIIFLGVIGFAFFIIWQKQFKTITQDDTFFVSKEDRAAGAGGSTPQKSDEKKESQTDDIDKVLGEEPKE
jgi:hypothetical protein